MNAVFHSEPTAMPISQHPAPNLHPHVKFPTPTARDNFPFAEIPDAQTTQWYLGTQVLTSVPTVDIDRYSERVNGLFEPREDHKGNVARAMFYFNTMYQSDITDPGFFDLQREALCQWHYLDPADSLEILRTYLIASYQDGRPNPFVLDCTLAARTYCPDTPGDCPHRPAPAPLHGRYREYQNCWQMKKMTPKYKWKKATSRGNSGSTPLVQKKCSHGKMPADSVG